MSRCFALNLFHAMVAIFATWIVPAFCVEFIASNMPSFACYGNYLKSRLMFKLSCRFNYKFLDAVKCSCNMCFQLYAFNIMRHLFYVSMFQRFCHFIRECRQFVLLILSFNVPNLSCMPKRTRQILSCAEASTKHIEQILLQQENYFFFQYFNLDSNPYLFFFCYPDGIFDDVLYF